MRAYQVIAQHMLSADQAVRTVRAASAEQAMAIAARMLADTDWYVVDAR